MTTGIDNTYTQNNTDQSVRDPNLPESKNILFNNKVQTVALMAITGIAMITGTLLGGVAFLPALTITAMVTIAVGIIYLIASKYIMNQINNDPLVQDAKKRAQEKRHQLNEEIKKGKSAHDNHLQEMAKMKNQHQREMEELALEAAKRDQKRQKKIAKFNAKMEKKHQKLNEKICNQPEKQQFQMKAKALNELPNFVENKLKQIEKILKINNDQVRKPLIDKQIHWIKEQINLSLNLLTKEQINTVLDSFIATWTDVEYSFLSDLKV